MVFLDLAFLRLGIFEPDNDRTRGRVASLPNVRHAQPADLIGNGYGDKRS
jgi:hypothetical protein